MENVPQIVGERLKASVSASHPEANLLTAFAERSLTEAERGTVLEHLSRCGECREIVALALPGVEVDQRVATLARTGWLSWPVFRWAFVTAAVVVIAVGALEYQKHSPPQPSTIVAKRVIQNEPMAADSEKRTAEQAPAPALPAEHKKDSSLASSNPDDLKEHSAATPGTTPKARGLVGAGNGIHRDPQAFQYQAQPPSRVEPTVPASAAKEPVGGASAGVSGAPAVEAVTVQAQRIGGPVVAKKQVAQAAPPSPIFDRYSGAIGKAKPAITAAQDENAPAAPRWSISATGGLQRSYDQGSTWQDVDVNAAQSPLSTAALEVTPKSKLARNQKALSTPSPPLTFRAVTANGADVWAGGSNASLFHSTDAGSHWTRVTPASAGTLLNGDIVALDFPTPQNGSISTSTGEVWSTSDGGQSWHKQ